MDDFDIRLDFDTDYEGPLFDGRAEEALMAFGRAAEEHIGQVGVDRIREYLPTQYKYLGHNEGNPEDNPVPRNAGYYQSQIQTERRMDDLLVTDGDVVYGPWLEGTSFRNETTRFKGYHTFRIIGQMLESEATTLAEEVLPPYVERMGG